MSSAILIEDVTSLMGNTNTDGVGLANVMSIGPDVTNVGGDSVTKGLGNANVMGVLDGTRVNGNTMTDDSGVAIVRVIKDKGTGVDKSSITKGGGMAEVSLEKDVVAEVKGSSVVINVLSNANGAEHGAHVYKGTISDYVNAMACVSKGRHGGVNVSPIH